MNDTPKLTGIGGWLAFLVLGLTLLGPLTGWSMRMEEIQDAEKLNPLLLHSKNWLALKQLSWLIFTASAALSITAGVSLWKIHKPRSVTIAIVALWICGPVASILQIVAILAAFGGAAMSIALSASAANIVGICIAAVVWTAYLVRSVRVRNTYRLSDVHLS